MSTKSEPIRALLKNNTAFIWEENEQKAFDEIKTLILNAPLLTYFNVAEHVEVQVDASSSGLGACLTKGGQPIQYASRALTDNEKCYSQIEGLLKGQKWKKETVSQNCGYRSYDVNVDGKLLRRNRVHLKEDQQVKVTEPSLKSGEQKPTAEDLTVAVVEKNEKKHQTSKSHCKGCRTC